MPAWAWLAEACLTLPLDRDSDEVITRGFSLGPQDNALVLLANLSDLVPLRNAGL